MSENNQTRRGFIAGGAAVIAAASASTLVQAAPKDEGGAASGKPKYAITTLHLKFNAETEFDTVMRAVIPLLRKRGVELVRAWTPTMGQYRKMMGVWKAASYDDFMNAFAAPELAAYQKRLEELGSATVEFATVLVEGTKKLSAEQRKGGVIATGTITLLPGQAEKFRRIVEDSIRIMGNHGMVLEGSFHTQIGERNRVLDLWWAPDANAAHAAVLDPGWATQLVDLDWTGTLAGEGSELAEISIELTFD